MKNAMRSVFILVGLILVGADVYSSQSIEERNAECLSTASNAKTGISVVRRENFQISTTVTTFDEITTCMSGSSKTCNEGTVHMRIANP